MANVNDLRNKAKDLWLKGMKAVGNTAASIASNTKYKVDEMTIQNRRREVLNDLAAKTYSLWLKGEELPEPLIKMLNELQQLDDQLNDMRAERYSYTGEKNQDETDSKDSVPEESDQDTAEEEKEEISPVSTEINEYFDEAASVGKMAEKVNSSLDQLSDRVRNFPLSAPENDGCSREQKNPSEVSE